MTKKTAHWTLAAFDIAGVLACYYVFYEWYRIDSLINTQADAISIQKHFTYLLLMSLVPITHFVILYEKVQFFKKWGNQLLIILLGISIFYAFSLSQRLDIKLSNNDFRYCNLKSKQMTFSEFRVYINQVTSCEK